MRKDALRRLRQLDAMDAMDELRQIVAAYRQRGGSPPLTWPALVRAGYLRGDPDRSRRRRLRARAVER